MKKSEQIVEFIRANNPRRKELVKFIVVNLNKIVTSEEWDELPSNHSYHAYYATNITKWRYQGNVEVNEKTKRYSMTKYYNGKLYGITSKVSIEVLERQLRNANQENERLRAKIKEIKEIVI